MVGAQGLIGIASIMVGRNPMAKNNQEKNSRKHPSPVLPTRENVISGSYIDFEGFAANEHQTSPSPVLLGIFNRNGKGTFEQIVFTKAFRWAAEDAGVEHPITFCPERVAFLRELVSEVRKAMPLYAYSEHELKVIQRETAVDMTPRFKNVRSIAQRWLNQRKDEHSHPASYALRDVATVMQVEMAGKLKRGGVTDRLRRVREYSKSMKKWQAAPGTVREIWCELLKHNRSDVMGIWEIMNYMRPD